MASFSLRINTLLALEAWDVAGGGSSLINATATTRTGDSIEWGYYSGDAQPTTPTTVNNGIDNLFKTALQNQLAAAGIATTLAGYTNTAIPGQRVEDMLDRQEQYDFPAFDPTVRRNLYIANGAGNSITGFGWLDRNDTPAQAVALMKQLFLQYAAKYPSALRILTLLPFRYGIAQPYEPTNPAWSANAFAEFNRLIRLEKANGATWFHAIADMGAHPIIGPWYAAADKTLMHDGVHHTAKLAALYVQVEAAAAVEAITGVPQPAFGPLPDATVAPADAFSDDPSRRRSDNNWESVSGQPAAFPGGYARFNQGANDGSVWFGSNIKGNGGQYIGPKSPNGGDFDAFVDGIYHGSDSAYASSLIADQVLYDFGNIPNGAFGDCHFVHFVKRSGILYDTKIKPSVTGTQLATPTLSRTATNDGGSLQWTNVNASSYLLQESRSSTFASGISPAYTGPNLATTLTGRLYRVPYYYRVTASKAGFTGSTSAIVKMTPGSPATQPPPIDMNGVLLYLDAGVGVTKDADRNVSDWADAAHGITLHTDAPVKPVAQIADPAFNALPTIVMVGAQDIGVTTSIGALAEFDMYVVFGVPDSNTQTLFSNRVGNPNWWSVNSNSIEIGSDAPITFSNTNYATATLLRVTFRRSRVTAYLNGVQVGFIDNPQSYSGASVLLMGYQYNGTDVIKRATASFSNAMFTQPRTDAQWQNDEANFYYKYAF